MRGILRVAAAAGLLVAFGAQGLHGQAAIVVGVGAGPIFPTKGESSFGPLVKSVGYHFQGIVGISPANGIVSGRVDAQYASVNYETSGSDTPKDKIFGVNGDIVIHPGNKGAGVRPYFLAGPSYYHFSFRTGTGIGDGSDSNFGFNGGAGLNVGTGNKLWFFIESRFIYTKDHSFIPVTLGVRINTAQAYKK
jgi:hypothetical protein